MKRLEAISCNRIRTLVPRRRAGVLMAWTIWIMLASCLIAGGVFNVMYTSGMRNQAYHCASSAAIAAGHGYLSDDMLRFRQEPFEIEGRMTRCRQKALSIVEEYRRQTRLPMLTEEDIKLTTPESNLPSNDASAHVPSEIAVCFDGDKPRNTIPQFFAGLTGNDRRNLGVRASVKLEHAPVGFRPGRNVSVPMLPFAICDNVIASEPDGAASSVEEVAADEVVDSSNESPLGGYWTSNIESGTGPDAFSWNEDGHLFENGPDGLPEITVTVYSTTSAGHDDAFIPMPFGATGVAGTTYARWISQGLTLEDLELTGQTEIQFPGQMNAGIIAPADLMACKTALESRIGEPLIVCLCSMASTSEGASTMTLERPVGVRIVQVTNAVSGSLKVVLQPCVLITSTAVTSANPSVNLNRYVYSVRLCQ